MRHGRRAPRLPAAPTFAPRSWRRRPGSEALYGDRLARVILYGSYARGDARPDSDVDVLVVLRGEYEPYAEIKRMGVPLYDVALRYDLALSAQPYRVEEVADGRRPFMRNVAADGVTL